MVTRAGRAEREAWGFCVLEIVVAALVVRAVVAVVGNTGWYTDRFDHLLNGRAEDDNTEHDRDEDRRPQRDCMRALHPFCEGNTDRSAQSGTEKDDLERSRDLVVSAAARARDKVDQVRNREDGAVACNAHGDLGHGERESGRGQRELLESREEERFLVRERLFRSRESGGKTEAERENSKLWGDRTKNGSSRRGM